MKEKSTNCLADLEIGYQLVIEFFEEMYASDADEEDDFTSFAAEAIQAIEQDRCLLHEAKESLETKEYHSFVTKLKQLMGYSPGKLCPVSDFVNYIQDQGKQEEEDVPRRKDRKEFYDLVDEIVETFERKNNDYAGVDRDMMANFQGCEQWGIPTLSGLITRWSDKVSRTQNLMRTGNQSVKDESLIDTFKDAAVYSLFIVIQLRRLAKEGK